MRMRKLIRTAAAALLAGGIALGGTATAHAEQPLTPAGVDVQCPDLAYGSAGVCAAVLQKQLNDHGAGLVVDGIVGPKTKAAIQDYQRAHGLAADGIAGPRTQASLVAEAPPPVVQQQVWVIEPPAKENRAPNLYDKVKNGVCDTTGKVTGALAGAAVTLRKAAGIAGGAAAEFGTETFVASTCKEALAIDPAW
ncbi:peptidoglycan-binding domain-containing protein [Streptomyces roseoverticillatus]|uniref:Peptidoglycan-binding domain-containing protein n=1 Tax=Streptomyces roseoverticillatus TaxID=66429 RepID=A0ABV3J4I1_9ACTN